jgi:hypothetical protein
VNIKPIETHYAGHRFRSRLEARWAVFFDHVGARWEYEPQGFVVNDRPYLPDFRLIDCGTYVEVKGCEEDLDQRLMHDAALQLPAVRGKGERGPRLLLLGPIPEPRDRGDWGWLGLHPLDVGDGEMAVFADWWGFGSYGKNRRPWALYGTSSAPPFEYGDDGWLTPALDEGEPGIPNAYRAARSARFEHGESG